MICQNCKGNGYLRLKFEAEESIAQCKVCDSQGEIKDDEYFHQYWDDGAGNPTYYYGPPLDVQEDEGFKNYEIYPTLTSIDSW